jgi:hypothetical protein
MNQITRTLSVLAFALVFMAGVAFAQENTASTTQNGSNSTADISQTNNAVGADQDNVATIISSDGNNDMDIVQTNNNSNASKVANNIASITSSGGNSVGSITQTNNPGGSDDVLGTITQSHGDNEATIEQIAVNGASAKITQTLGNAEAFVEQNSAAGKLVEAVVTQEGNNYAEVRQANRNLDAFVTQINTGGAMGSLNEAYVSQGQASGAVVGADAHVYQEGEGNYVDLGQERASFPFSHRANFDQIGDYNSIRLFQDGSAPGDGAFAEVLQDGSGNIFEGLDGGDDAVQGSSSSITAKTYGNDNLIQIEQGVQNTANIFQGVSGAPSDNNTAIVDQSGATGSTANVTQN